MGVGVATGGGPAYGDVARGVPGARLGAEPMTDARLRGWITAAMQRGGALTLTHAGGLLPVRVIAGPPPSGRVDGLRDDVAVDPGFSFAVTEARLEIDAPALAPAALAAVHDVLVEAARDFDWIGYSHVDGTSPAAIAADPVLRLYFSSAVKGADALGDVLAALGVPVEAVAAGPS